MGWIIGILVAVLLFWGLYEAVGAFFYRMAIDAHSEKWFLKPPKKTKKKTIEGADSYSALENDARETKERDLDTAYFDSHEAQIAEIVSTDGKDLVLKGYYYPAEQPSDKWLLFFHGYASSVLWSRRWIRTMSERGYHVLAPDMRGHGMSEGDYIGMGWDERLDVVAWADWIARQNPQAQILVFPVSQWAVQRFCVRREKRCPNRSSV